MKNNKYALISVFDKTGIVELAKFFQKNNIKIISTGGTYKHLKQNKIDVIELSKFTNFPEMLDSRVKTLHPKIHGGILAIRKNKNHLQQIKKQGIQLIDFVVVNLYPFFEKVKEKLTFEQKVEFIDIGGPTMLRSAAKNFQDVTVITNPKDYQLIMDEYEKNKTISFSTKKMLAAKVFNLTSAYDAAISNFLTENEYDDFLSVSYRKKMDLRYGENPHQTACFYESTTQKGSMNSFEILNGKQLSYNNFKDVDVAWKAVCEFDKKENACCVLKHNTPCGFSLGKTVYDAYMKAYKTDPVSIFGGIVAFNNILDGKTANELSKLFLEIVAAPGFSKEALNILCKKKNLRVLKFTTKPTNKHSLVSVDGGILIQSEDVASKEKYKVVTKLKPTKKQMEDLIFAMKVVKHVKSNAIVVADNKVILGIGGGQVNRVWPTEDALKRAKKPTVLASDAFFPFRDVVDIAAKYKIKAIIQPGGSIRDEESIKACNEHKIAMVFTGVRHFKH